MKTLVLYVFHLYNARVKHFIQNVTFKDNNIDFLIICNNMTEDIEYPLNAKLIRRENTGLDFGGWSQGLLKDNLYNQYDAFIFLNSSIMGPYLPENYTGTWVDRLLYGLEGDVKLFGPTINSCFPDLKRCHIQSYAFCMHRPALELLINKEIFSLTHIPKNYLDAIRNFESPMSRVILDNGWNIGSFMNHYKDVDFTFKNKNLNVEFLGSVMEPDKFFGNSLDPREVMFIKGNRYPPGYTFKYNNITNIFQKYSSVDNSKGIDKIVTHSYGEIYNKIFKELYPTTKSVLSIGVGCGLDLRSYYEYFTRALIYGVNINGTVHELISKSPRIKLVTPDDLKTLQHDLIIEDASHKPEDQIQHFKNYGKSVKSNGYYIIEDVNQNCFDLVREETLKIAQDYGFTQSVYDLRKIKNRFDDILLVFKKL